jgi:hypothetical protein
MKRWGCRGIEVLVPAAHAGLVSAVQQSFQGLRW